MHKLLTLLAAGFVLASSSIAAAQPVTPAGPPPSDAAQPQAPRADEPAPADATPNVVVVDQGFALGVGDVVAVGVIGRSEFNVRARVAADGTIVLPLLGAVKAINSTAAELAASVQTALSKGGFYSNPVVRVEVVGVASRYATILGNVARPGLMPLDRTYHLSDVIARAGVRPDQNSSSIVLTHADGSSKKYSIDDLATGAGQVDPVIAPGDKIYVPAATSEVFYINGQVRAPGPYSLGKEITVREAIARGGGLTEMGSDRKVKIYRKNVALKGVKLDTKLEPGDIVEVGERLF